MHQALGHICVLARVDLFLVENVALRDPHAGPAVEPGRPRNALGVHAETDYPNAAAVELAEGVPE